MHQTTSPPKTPARQAHRLHKPLFSHTGVKHPLVKTVIGKIDAHDFARNNFLNKLRTEGGQVLGVRSGVKTIEPRRNKMRTEREETLRELVKALAYRADFDDSGEHFLEVKASIKTLANDIKQLHRYGKDYNGTGQYRHGRDTYEPVKNAMHDLEAAGLVITQRHYDTGTKRYQANRTWLTPEIFQCIGITKAQLVKFIQRHRKAKGLTKEDRRTKLISEQARMARDSRLQECVKPALKKRLKKLESFNAIVEGREEIKSVKQTLRKLNNQESKQSKDNSPAAFYNQVQLPAVDRMELERILSEQFPDVQAGTWEYYQRYREIVIQHFPQYTPIRLN